MVAFFTCFLPKLTRSYFIFRDVCIWTERTIDKTDTLNKLGNVLRVRIVVNGTRLTYIA